MTVPPSARCSQARRRRTGVVTPNGLKPFATDAAGQQQFGGLADQRRSRPAQCRIRHDEDETAPGVRLVDEVGRGQHQVAPALPAVEQGATQRRIGDDRVGHDARVLSRIRSLNAIRANEALLLRVDRSRAAAHGPAPHVSRDAAA
jgi:hypothetical protein